MFRIKNLNQTNNLGGLETARTRLDHLIYICEKGFDEGFLFYRPTNKKRKGGNKNSCKKQKTSYKKDSFIPKQTKSLTNKKEVSNMPKKDKKNKKEKNTKAGKAAKFSASPLKTLLERANKKFTKVGQEASVVTPFGTLRMVVSTSGVSDKPFLRMTLDGKKISKPVINYLCDFYARKDEGFEGGRRVGRTTNVKAFFAKNPEFDPAPEKEEKAEKTGKKDKKGKKGKKAAAGNGAAEGFSKKELKKTVTKKDAKSILGVIGLAKKEVKAVIGEAFQDTKENTVAAVLAPLQEVKTKIKGVKEAFTDYL